MKHYLKIIVAATLFGLLGTMSIEVQAAEVTGFSNLLCEGTHPVTFLNDVTFPWTVSNEGIATSNNPRKRFTSSSLTFNYNSEYQTEVSMSLCKFYNWYHFLSIYIDGIKYQEDTDNSWRQYRFILSKGSHTFEIRDSISDINGDEIYGQIKNIMVRDIKNIENAVLSSNSVPLLFTNDEKNPWLTYTGYISNSNYGMAKSSCKCTSTFSIDTPSMLKFDHAQSAPWNMDTNTHSLRFYINRELYGVYGGNENTYATASVVLLPGKYTVELQDSMSERSEECHTFVKNIELNNKWSNITVATPGTLGVEVLYNFNVLNDVEMLSIIGTLDETDLNTIKQMNNLTGLDLSLAKFKNIPDYAFDGLSRLSYVKLPDGVISIGDYAFRGTQIWNIVIPSSVTSIGQYAFKETRIKNIKFADNSQLQSIGYEAFRSCNSLSEFVMPSHVKVLHTYNLNNYNSNDETNTFRGCSALKKLIFSDSITVISNNTCCDCTSLSDVHLQKSLNSINDGAFANTFSLHQIIFPENLNYIGHDAFYASSLASIVLPIKLTSLSYFAFRNCDSLKYIELPSYISSYDNNFLDCNNIQTVVCKSATPPAITNDLFTNGPAKSGITLYVPSFAVANYKLDPYWYQFGNIQEMNIDLNYWRVSGNLILANNRRMNGKPDLDLYYGSQTSVSGNAPFETHHLNLYTSTSNSFRLLNNCDNMKADSITSYYSLKSNQWYFFTPIFDINLANVSHTTNASFVFRYYNGQQRATSGAGSSWQNVSDGILHAGQGYILHCNSDGEIIMPAIKEKQNTLCNTKEVKLALSVYESENSANKNWNYVGNPYPCYYDVHYMDFTAPITVRNDNNYYAYSISDDNYVLAPMQSFFVQKPD